MSRWPFLATIVLLSLTSGKAAGDDQPPEPVHVGILHSLSGTMAISERSLVDAIRMAIDEVNTNGGVLGRPTEAIQEDGASDWPTFSRKAQKLITEDKVVSVFGCWTSASREAVRPVVEQHTWKVARIGRIQTDGQFRIVWSSEDPLPPRRWLPESFVAIASDHGRIMFEHISAMIDLERDEPADSERRKLLAAMADVRGHLGDARSRFHVAVLLPQPGNRAAFDGAWQEFETRCTLLTDHQSRFTDRQRESFEHFEAARDAFRGNADRMYSVVYPEALKVSEVTP